MNGITNIPAEYLDYSIIPVARMSAYSAVARYGGSA